MGKTKSQQHLTSFTWAVTFPVQFVMGHFWPRSLMNATFSQVGGLLRILAGNAPETCWVWLYTVCHVAWLKQSYAKSFRLCLLTIGVQLGENLSSLNTCYLSWLTHHHLASLSPYMWRAWQLMLSCGLWSDPWKSIYGHCLMNRY